MKTCTKCGRDKFAIDFYRKASAKDGLQSECKVCHDADTWAYRVTGQGWARQSIANDRSRDDPPPSTARHRLIREMMGLPGSVQINLPDDAEIDKAWAERRPDRRPRSLVKQKNQGQRT